MEMLLVLTIGGLLVAVAVPNFGPLLTRAQLYTAVRDVASGLRYVRGQALSRGREAEFEIDVFQHLYRVSGRNRPYKLPDSVNLSLFTAETETVDEGVGRIRFFPDGSATGGRVTLESGGRKREVDVVWLTGEVRVHEDDGEND